MSTDLKKYVSTMVNFMCQYDGYCRMRLTFKLMNSVKKIAFHNVWGPY